MAVKRSYRKIRNKHYLINRKNRQNKSIAVAVFGTKLKKKSSRKKKKTKLTSQDKARLRYQHAIWNIQDRLGINRNNGGT